MKKKNLLTAAASLALVAVIGVGATLAYFTDKTEVKTNVFTTGNVDVELIDEAFKVDEDEIWTYEKNEKGGYDYSNVMPGDQIGKNVAVAVQEGSQDCYVAIRVFITNESDPEGLVTDMQPLYDQIVAASEQRGWLCADGGAGSLVFYYPHAISANSAENTAYLFSYLNIPGEWGNEYVGAELNIDVAAAAVQAANLPAPELGNTTVDELNKLFVG